MSSTSRASSAALSRMSRSPVKVIAARRPRLNQRVSGHCTMIAADGTVVR